jgi:hypothetical protein
MICRMSVSGLCSPSKARSNVVVPQRTSQDEKEAAENLLEKAPLGQLSGVLK